MEKIYNPKLIEEPIYKFWEQGNYFKSYIKNHNENYCIAMPPPNITGELHLGHAFQQTIMDTLIRYQRMQGKNTLWQAGIDHAGIATQTLIEHKIVHNKNKNEKNYTKDQLIKTAWEWKEKSEKLIIYQMKRLGNSIDWKRTRFTMDTEMSYSVKEAFIQLYQNNLIYKGKKLVNWDTELQTAISDLEVSNKQIKDNIWYIRYLLEDNTSNTKLNYLTVATTRPETILGDTAVAIHPEDSRYQKLIGKYVITPITNRLIPIISDKYVDMKKETGCLKITPAHDFNDYIIGQKHNLPMIKIFSSNGKILETPEIFDTHGNTHHKIHCNIPKIFHKLNKYHARKQMISECIKLNLLESTKLHNITIPYNERNGVTIEPMLTTQWYLRTSIIAKHAIHAVKNGIINFVPKQYENMYFSWMNNVQDWCISRQIWWGHRIPVWYDDNNQIYVGHCEQDIRTKYKINNTIKLKKDTNVLDTWFSSGLWTFSSLGWPKHNKILNTFHPTNVIVSGFDIIFFWIARMIMFSMYFIKDKNNNPQVPFKTIYITGLILDEFGKKMSKSTGNVIDPLDLINGISIKELLKKRTTNISCKQLTKKIIQNTKKQFPNGIKSYGSDSLRFTLIALASSGRNIHWDMQRLEGYHNFCNKLWNASRFILNNIQNKNCEIYNKKKSFSTADQWITTQFNQTVKHFHQTLIQYRFDKIANILYEFVWHQFCNWYIEFTKPIIFHDNILELRGTLYTLITLLESILKLIHPIMPFITEKIWQEIRNITGKNNDSIMIQPFPKYNSDLINTKSTADIEWIKHIITKIRAIRIDMYIQQNIPLQLIFKNSSAYIKELILKNYKILSEIAKIKDIIFDKNNNTYPKSIPILIGKIEILVIIPKLFNKEIAITRLHKELTLINNKIKSIQDILNNNHFIHQAPTTVIITKKEKLNDYIKTQKKLINKYSIITML